MFSTLKLHCKQNKPLIIAMLFSLLLHMLFLVESPLQLPDDVDDEQTLLKMRLVNLPAKKTAVPVMQKTQKAKPDRPPKQPKQTPPDIIEPSPSAEPAHDASVIGQAPDPAAIQTPAAENPADVMVTEAEPPPVPYEFAETVFDVYRNNDATPAGKTIITFSLDKNHRYFIKSTTQAKGLASLILDTLQQKSEGLITEGGLRPDYYSYEYGNKKSQIANFSWNDGVLIMHTAKGTKTEKLSAGTQDLLSFMYQFMFTPPLESLVITMTNGKNLRTYAYSFEGEEVIDTKFSRHLKTVHLVKTGSEEDKTEIWLATDYKYLPIKIRKTEKDGTTIEQIMTNISTEPPQ